MEFDETKQGTPGTGAVVEKFPKDIEQWRDTVRAEERARARLEAGAIDELQRQNTLLTGLNTTLQRTVEDLQTRTATPAVAEAEADPKAEYRYDPAEEGEVKALIQQVVKTSTDQLRNDFDEVLSAKEARIQELEGRLHYSALNEHRTQLLSQANGRIVEELLTGNSVEELNDAYARARQKYEEYEARILDTRKEGPTVPRVAYAPPSVGRGPVGAMTAPAAGSAEADLMARLQALPRDRETWEKTRKTMLAEMQRMIPRQR